MTFEAALGLVRLLINNGVPREEAISNPAVPVNYREGIRLELVRDDNIVLEPAGLIAASARRDEWLRQLDRSAWYYWPRLREYLLGVNEWQLSAVRSLDEVTDKILGQLAPPARDMFDVRGLVLGYVQSGKTASFTALIAKAADVGYRLVIVLSGVDNGLRRQTQIRLKRELVGYTDNRPRAVRFPPLGRQWHEFTREDINGDFDPGFANQAALQGSQPVLLVVKKNGRVLRRLLAWLDQATDDVRRSIPLLVVDDEADQASVDTRGSYQAEGEPLPDDYEEPSTINGLIRDLLRRFQRKAYVAYTATPFANIFIPHDTFDPNVANDLYPKDFIVDLPKPAGYFGAEELFGRFDTATNGQVGGLDIIEDVSDEELQTIRDGDVPSSLENAVIDFVLAGSARAQRGQGSKPATMLIHLSHLIVQQQRMADIVGRRFAELRDEWRYQRDLALRDRLRVRWEQEFRPVTRAADLGLDVPFSSIEPYVGPFFEAVQVRVINSSAGEVLDYEQEPDIKAIAVGGNRLSRGLTLEGLLVSFFVRRTLMYDTLMQMGRWFGFREGYEDLTRIFITPELQGWFSDLAFVENRLREDLRIYEEQDLTPYQVGMRIWQHPTMQVTSRLKRRFAGQTTISQSYSFKIEQTFKFPLRRLADLAVIAEENLNLVRTFLATLGDANWSDRNGPYWTGKSPDSILQFLEQFRVDEETATLSLPLIRSYIEKQVDRNELQRWTIAVRGLQTRNNSLGEAMWGVQGGSIWQIGRTRIGNTDSLGAVTDQDDEAVGLSPDAQARMAELQASGKSLRLAARGARPPEEGLLLLYPISRNSGYNSPDDGGNRRPLFDDPNGPLARDLIALAISFPEARLPEPRIDAYLEGTAGWRPVE